MITILALIVIMLALGGLLGILMARDPGYVLIAYDSMTLETSLWVGLLIGGLLWAGATFGWALLKRLLKSRGAWFRWRREGRRLASQKRTEEALLLRAEGRWNDALAAYASAADNAELPFSNWIHAAEAAHRAGDESARDELFRKAELATPHSALALALIKAGLQQESGQWAESEETLGAWIERAPRHPRLNTLRIKAAAALDDWNTVHALLPTVSGPSHLSAAELHDLAVHAWRARLDEVALSEIAPDHAQSLWKTIPAAVRLSPLVVGRFVEILATSDEHGPIAEATLREALDHELSLPLLQRYAATITDPAQQAEAVTRWLERATAQAVEPVIHASLLYIDARLAEARGEHDVERRLAECLNVYPLAEAKAALGRHLLSLGNAPAAREVLSGA